jgi:8-oxo-dGTP pyrophosphatase MutT (NUDIX family)
VLHLIPAPLHRVLYRLADRGRRLWWRWRKPNRSSVIVVIFDHAGRVLLVRHSYGRPLWTVPGGGMDKGEDPAVSAAREVREELGCELAGLTALGPFQAYDSGSHDCRHVFAARAVGEPEADQREIVAVRWFDPAALPADTSPLARRFIRQALGS